MCCVNALLLASMESSGLPRLISIDKYAHEHALAYMHVGKQVRALKRTHALEMYADLLHGVRCYPDNLARLWSYTRILVLSAPPSRSVMALRPYHGVGDLHCSDRASNKQRACHPSKVPVRRRAPMPNRLHSSHEFGLSRTNSGATRYKRITKTAGLRIQRRHMMTTRHLRVPPKSFRNSSPTCPGRTGRTPVALIRQCEIEQVEQGVEDESARPPAAGNTRYHHHQPCERNFIHHSVDCVYGDRAKEEPCTKDRQR